MGLFRSPWLVVTVMVMLGMAGGAGYTYGTRQAELRAAAALSRAQAATMKAAEAASVNEAARLAAEALARDSAQALEDAANAEPVTSPVCLPASRVRRLNLR